MNVLLVQPYYYTRYPPLGLLKLSAYHKARGDSVGFVRGCGPVGFEPDTIYLTSLFTYAWKPVHDAAAYYRTRFPRAKIVLGGIYATLMPDHARLAAVDEVHVGLFDEAEDLLPDYSLVDYWDSSIMFGTRGCIRKCAFCAVPRLEGKVSGPARGIGHLIKPGHEKVILWDNNILGVPNWQEVVEELKALGVAVDFNQGLDARLITDEVANTLKGLKMYPIRMAYDHPSEKKGLEQAIPALTAAGFRKKSIVVYTLFNFTDTPEDFFHRVRDLLSWGVVSYPMRYEPLNSLTKNKYVSPHWNETQLDKVAQARRVLGFGGAFPPYAGLVRKLQEAASFDEAFELREGPSGRRAKGVFAGTMEAGVLSPSEPLCSYRELLNDPTTLGSDAICDSCRTNIDAGQRAFAVQDACGRYVSYRCPGCHPNKKWVHALWRGVTGERTADLGLDYPLSLPSAHSLSLRSTSLAQRV